MKKSMEASTEKVHCEKKPHCGNHTVAAENYDSISGPTYSLAAVLGSSLGWQGLQEFP